MDDFLEEQLQKIRVDVRGISMQAYDAEYIELMSLYLIIQLHQIELDMSCRTKR